MNFVSHGVQDYLGITPAAGALFQEVLTGTNLPANLKYYGFHPMASNYVPSYFLFNLNGTYTFREGPATGLSLFVAGEQRVQQAAPGHGWCERVRTGQRQRRHEPDLLRHAGLGVPASDSGTTSKGTMRTVAPVGGNTDRRFFFAGRRAIRRRARGGPTCS